MLCHEAPHEGDPTQRESPTSPSPVPLRGIPVSGWGAHWMAPAALGGIPGRPASGAPETRVSPGLPLLSAAPAEGCLPAQAASLASWEADAAST